MTPREITDEVALLHLVPRAEEGLVLDGLREKDDKYKIEPARHAAAAAARSTSGSAR